MRIKLTTGRIVGVRVTDESPGRFGATTYDTHHGSLTKAELHEIAEGIHWYAENPISEITADRIGS